MSQSDPPNPQNDAPASRSGWIRKSKLTQTILWFILWLLLANVASESFDIHWWNPYTFSQHTASMDVACHEYRDSEVMIVGSSFARWGIASPVLEEELSKKAGRPVRVYNTGAQSAHIRDTRARTRSLFEYARPRLLIFATTTGEFREQGTDRNHLFYASHASPYDLLTIDFWPPDSFKKVKNLINGLFRPAQLPFQWLLQNSSRFPRDRKRALNLAGWLNSTKRFSPRSIDKRLDWQGTHKSWEHLIAIKQLAATHRCRLVVVRLPYDSENEQLLFSDEAMETFGDQLNDFCQKNSIPLFDLQKHPTLESTDFNGDGQHLMGRGAKKMTNHLVPWLAEWLDNIPPNDPARPIQKPAK